MSRFLITAGNTQSLIDKVRCITNIFTGRTGTNIAVEAALQGHAVVLLSSNCSLLDTYDLDEVARSRISPVSYTTFGDLRDLLPEYIKEFRPDVIVHSAAVSDFEVEGVYSQSARTKDIADNSKIEFMDFLQREGDGKVSSKHNELWLRLVPTEKLIDLIRVRWNFDGILVKFKLEVDINEGDLLDRAEKARSQSQAEIIVANRLEDARQWAYIGCANQSFRKVSRESLAKELLGDIEKFSDQEK